MNAVRGETTTTTSTMITTTNLQLQQQQPQPADFWWWWPQQNGSANLTSTSGGHQHQQISSSGSAEQMDTADFEGFDLSLLISGAYYNEEPPCSAATTDCRVPVTDGATPPAAISATVTVHTNAAQTTSPTGFLQQDVGGDADAYYYLQQLDLQQLLSLYDDDCGLFSDSDKLQLSAPVITTTAVEARSLPEHRLPPAYPKSAVAVVSTTTAVQESAGVVPAVSDSGNGAADKTTLLRSLLTSSPSVGKLSDIAAAAVVESTSEPTLPVKSSGQTVNGSERRVADKHKLLVEMLRGDVIVPTATTEATRPPVQQRRRPRASMDSADDDGNDSDGSGPQDRRRRRLLTDDSQPLSEWPSAAWLDRMVANAATNNQPFCFPDGTKDNASALFVDYTDCYPTAMAYSPPTAAQVPSITPPPPSCDPITTTTTVCLLFGNCHLFRQNSQLT